MNKNMKRFKGTAICQFNVDVEVIAKNEDQAEEKIFEIVNTAFDDEFSVDVKGLNVVICSYDECFEVLDIEEIKRELIK